MPTLANPRQYFGLNRKPYDSYFQRPEVNLYDVPPNTDPYGQAGQEERQLAAQQKVQEILGQLDALEESKRDRALRQKYLPQTQQLQEEGIQSQLAKIGQFNRQQAARRDVAGIDWSTPEGRARASQLAAQSPEHQAAVQDAFRVQSQIQREHLFGQDNDAIKKQILDMEPRDRALVTQEMQNGSRFEEAQAKLAHRNKHEKQAAELIGLGIPTKEHAALMDGESFHPLKVEEAKRARKEADALKRLEEQKLTLTGYNTAHDKLQKATTERDKWIAENPEPPPPTVAMQEAAAKRALGKTPFDPKNKAHWDLGYKTLQNEAAKAMEPRKRLDAEVAYHQNIVDQFAPKAVTSRKEDVKQTEEGANKGFTFTGDVSQSVRDQIAKLPPGSPIYRDGKLIGHKK